MYLGFLLLAMPVATAAPAGTVASVPEETCPFVCPQTTQRHVNGTQPPELFIDFTGSAPGTHVWICATCKPCKADFFLAFNGGGGATCMWYDTVTAHGGPFNNLPPYARPGVLRTNCDSPPDWVYAYLSSCTDESQVSCSVLLWLECGCAF